MNQLHISTIAAAIALTFSAGAMAAQGISKDDYRAGKEKIVADYKAAVAGCEAQTGNAKDICKVDAKGKEKVSMAELHASHKPGAKADREVGMAHADADYALAREKCDDKAGVDKDNCLKDAKAAHRAARSSAHAPMAAAPAATSAAAPAPTPAGKETPGAYVDDAVITTKVKAEILNEPSLKSTEINVETYKGIVQLTGFVRSRANIDRAVEVARKVKGVNSVKNDMVVKGQQ